MNQQAHVAGGAGRAGRQTAAEVIAGAGLPPELAGLVERVVKGSRLWPSERAEVARELCGHFAEGLEAGESAESLAREFGDAARAAKLIRRARVRLRPLWWRAARRTLHGCMGLLLAGVLGYGVLAARYFGGSPNVSRNYMAEFNAPVLAMPEGERAWPGYLGAIAAFGQEPAWMQVDPAERDAAAVEAWVRSTGPAFEMARGAAAKPALGAALSSRLQPEYVAALRASGRQGVMEEGPGPENPLMMGVLLPHLGEMRRIARYLNEDMKLAARDGDAARFKADVRAMLGMAGQNVREQLIISQLVGLAIFDLTIRGVDEHARTPGVLSDSDLRDLAHMVGGFEGGRVRIDVTGERVMVDDIIQRCYSDDGDGDGRVVRTNLGEFMYDDFGVARPKGLPLITAAQPVLTVTMPGRREVTRRTELALAAAAADEAMPPWRHGERRCDTGYRDLFEGAIYRLVPVAESLMGGATDEGPMVSAFGSRDIVEARRGALLAGLALELYRRETGAWPQTLDALVPRYMPSVPLDPFDGKPMRYSLSGGVATLYSIGADAKDDGGVPPATESGKKNVNSLRLFVKGRSGAPVSVEQQQALNKAKGDWVVWRAGPVPGGQ
ncbi:MAG: hypothetical protein IT433_00415 [Phycisphaerales bacterium]|nr:hypothetical protein [Phycisphaerales bacterium]